MEALIIERFRIFQYKFKIKVMLGSIIYLVVLVGVLSIVKYFIFKFLD